jgi:hypothetical protein
VPPLVYTSEASFPRNRKFIGRLVQALQHCADQRLVTSSGGVLWFAAPVAPPEASRQPERPHPQTRLTASGGVALGLAGDSPATSTPRR